MLAVTVISYRQFPALTPDRYSRRVLTLEFNTLGSGLPLGSCVALGKSLHLSDLRFLSCKLGIIVGLPHRMMKRFQGNNVQTVQ